MKWTKTDDLDCQWLQYLHTYGLLSGAFRPHLIRVTGVDLTAIPGIEASTALKIVSEIGLDLSRW